MVKAKEEAVITLAMVLAKKAKDVQEDATGLHDMVKLMLDPLSQCQALKLCLMQFDKVTNHWLHLQDLLRLWHLLLK